MQKLPHLIRHGGNEVDKEKKAKRMMSLLKLLMKYI